MNYTDRFEEEEEKEQEDTHRWSNKKNKAQVIFDIEKVLNARFPEIHIKEFPE